jgi:predicted nucleic acid-binding protein
VIFLDTGFVFALVYADDVHHARVRRKVPAGVWE